jgi:hypothetical protein
MRMLWEPREVTVSLLVRPAAKAAGPTGGATGTGFGFSAFGGAGFGAGTTAAATGGFGATPFGSTAFGAPATAAKPATGLVLHWQPPEKRLHWKRLCPCARLCTRAVEEGREE